MGLIWFSMAVPNASAAIRELDRIIVSSTIAQDRTYEIVVEDISAGLKEKRSSNPERRPPRTAVRRSDIARSTCNRFVLIRRTEEGLPFITGSNGNQSWAVNTRGPVRVSQDIHRFDHDLPGHETSIPLTNLHDGLQQLKRAYELTFSVLGPEEYNTENGHDARLLVAVKKPQERGHNESKSSMNRQQDEFFGSASFRCPMAQIVWISI